LHQFDFMAGTWKAHLTSTQFGPAYQLFVPYSRKGYHQADLALRLRLTPPNGMPLYSDLARVSLLGYERAKEKDENDSYEPTASSANSNNDNFTRSEKITPQLVGETLFQVLAERRETAGSTELAAAETAADLRSSRQIRRGVAAHPNESSGEYSVPDEPNHSAIRRRHQPVQSSTEADGQESDE
ncbi:MAG: hypothetical protein FD138_3415, partial [Planctomycetota bacterium]